MFESEKELRWIRLLLTIIAIPVVVIILKTLKAIFIPLIFAIFLSFVFAPLNAYLSKRKIPMVVTFLILLVIIVAFFAVLSFIVYAASNSLILGFPKYQEKFYQTTMETWQGFQSWLTQTNLALGNLSLIDISKLLSPSGFSITKTVTDTMGTFMNVLWNLFLTLVFLMFIVGGSVKLEKRLTQVLSSDRKSQTISMLYNIQSQMQKYLFTKTLISLATAIVGAILMLFFGVDFVLVVGIMLFVLNFIPNIGSIIASLLPMLICLLQYGFGGRLVIFSVCMIGTQMLFGNIIEPKIQGNGLNLTPIMVLISLIFWGWLWGIVGMIFAVPITSGINIILKQLDEKNIISAIISGN
ncbi:MAG: AI-2E family transporter [Candidatus Cloacimonadaceae bacterium]|nr:AI-2E family transporter [Candidatus Cloacimonadaceae bacterium]MDP3114552.1 AI-2E family transporter [Candidatus Cloacimonadaceae bacterium]